MTGILAFDLLKEIRWLDPRAFRDAKNVVLLIKSFNLVILRFFFNYTLRDWTSDWPWPLDKVHVLAVMAVLVFLIVNLVGKFCRSPKRSCVKCR